jgi:two-component system, NarL family, invasion response regulator UvrY
MPSLSYIRRINPLITVLIVDDHSLIRDGIKRMLNDVPGIKVVGEAENGRVAITLAKQLRPDVILMDIQMPEVDGMVATQRILQWNPAAKILIVTVCDGDLYSSKLLQQGAAGYITKDAKWDEMVQAIRAVHAGQRYISPTVAQRLAFKHVTDTGQSPFDALSGRELQIVRLIIHGSKPQEIAKKHNISAKTVNSYRYRVFEKLNVGNDVELTLLAIRHGLVDPAVIGRQ